MTDRIYSKNEIGYTFTRKESRDTKKRAEKRRWGDKTKALLFSSTLYHQPAGSTGEILSPRKLQAPSTGTHKTALGTLLAIFYLVW
jgi:hypothetical protein